MLIINNLKRVDNQNQDFKSKTNFWNLSFCMTNFKTFIFYFVPYPRSNGDNCIQDTLPLKALPSRSC